MTSDNDRITLADESGTVAVFLKGPTVREVLRRLWQAD